MVDASVMRVQLVNKEAWLIRLTKANKEAVPAVKEALTLFSSEARDAIKAAIPTPPRSGNRVYGATTLGESYTTEFKVTSTTVQALFTSPLAYAGIVERGGDIGAHEVSPTTAKVLAFNAALSSRTAAIDMLFAPKVEIPSWTYSGKHYVAKTLESMRGILKEMVITAINGVTA